MEKRCDGKEDCKDGSGEKDCRKLILKQGYKKELTPLPEIGGNVSVKFSPLYSPQSNGLIERQHRAIKESLIAALHSMGDIHKSKWFWQLPWTMLGRRVAYSPDLGASPAQLTMGATPVIPGGLVNSTFDTFRVKASSGDTAYRSSSTTSANI